MTELIKVSQNENGKQVVSARELHLFLEVKTDFTDWCKQMFNYGFENGVDYSLFKIGERSVHNKVDYVLTLDCAKSIGMIQKSEKGTQIRNYFIECEKQLKQSLPQTYIESLLALVASEQEKERLALQVDNLSTALDVLVEWVSIIKVANFNNVNKTNFDWKKLKSKSKEMGFVIKKVVNLYYGYQNLYHISTFKVCYPQFKYNFK